MCNLTYILLHDLKKKKGGAFSIMFNIPEPNIKFISKEQYEALQKMDEDEADLHDRLVIAGYWPWWRRLLHPYKPITVDQYATVIPPRPNKITKSIEEEKKLGQMQAEIARRMIAIDDWLAIVDDADIRRKGENHG